MKEESQRPSPTETEIAQEETRSNMGSTVLEMQERLKLHSTPTVSSFKPLSAIPLESKPPVDTTLATLKLENQLLMKQVEQEQTARADLLLQFTNLKQQNETMQQLLLQQTQLVQQYSDLWKNVGNFNSVVNPLKPMDVSAANLLGQKRKLESRTSITDTLKRSRSLENLVQPIDTCVSVRSDLTGTNLNQNRSNSGLAPLGLTGLQNLTQLPNLTISSSLLQSQGSAPSLGNVAPFGSSMNPQELLQQLKRSELQPNGGHVSLPLLPSGLPSNSMVQTVGGKTKILTCLLCEKKGLKCVFEGRSKVCLNCKKSKKKCERVLRTPPPGQL